MKTSPLSSYGNKKSIHNKSNFSHVTSRLFSSQSKSKQKPHIPTTKEQILRKTLKLSIEKVEQIGEQKYKQAMRHVEKFKILDEEIKKRKINPKPDAECTFKPKLTNNKKYNPESRFMNITLAERHLKKYKQKDSENHLPKSPSLTPNKDSFNQTSELKPKKKKLGQKLAQRLMNWGKERDSKIINKKFQVEVSKSISRTSSIGSQTQRKSTMSKEKSYRQLYQKKLEIKAPSETHDTSGREKHPLSNSYVRGYEDMTTSRKSSKTNNEMTRSMISLQSANSIKTEKRKQLLDGLLEDIKFDKIEEKERSAEEDLFIKKRMKFYTEVRPSLEGSKTVGEKILLNQSQRGEGSFYLRQAKANISKDYQKTEVLVKNNQYSKNFSVKYTNAIVLKDKNIKK